MVEEEFLFLGSFIFFFEVCYAGVGGEGTIVIKKVKSVGGVCKWMECLGVWGRIFALLIKRESRKR